MPDTSLALVQRLYERYSEGSVEELFAALHPGFTLTSCGPATEFRTSGVWAGAAGLRDYLERLHERWIVEEHTPLEFIQQGPRIVVRTRVRTRSRDTGQCATLEKADFWTVEGGQVRSYQEIFDTATVLSGCADPFEPVPR